MLYEANIFQMEVEGHVFWVAKSKVLNGCVGQGETPKEAIRELEENELEWISAAKECGISIPPQVTKKVQPYSGKVSLRMSPYVHEKAAEAAEALGISLNQFINDAVISYTKDVTGLPNTPPKNNLYVFESKKKM